MTTLTRDEILSAVDRKTETVPVPEWKEGAELTVATWSARQRDEFDKFIFANRKKPHMDTRAAIVALSVVDPETLEPIFTVKDIDALTKKSHAPMNRLFNAAAELNPITQGAQDEIAKNS
jgi:hypothetical protein